MKLKRSLHSPQTPSLGLFNASQSPPASSSHVSLHICSCISPLGFQPAASPGLHSECPGPCCLHGPRSARLLVGPVSRPCLAADPHRYPKARKVSLSGFTNPNMQETLAWVLQSIGGQHICRYKVSFVFPHIS